jgi:hypothetical protein
MKYEEVKREHERRKASKEKILATLREAGLRGVTNLELNEIAFRYGARIFELRKLGYEIDKEYVEPGVWRYTLLSEPENLEAAQ